MHRVCWLLTLTALGCASTPPAAVRGPAAQPGSGMAPSSRGAVTGGLIARVDSPDTHLYVDDQEMHEFVVLADNSLRLTLLPGVYALRARRGEVWTAAQRVRVCAGQDTHLAVALDAAGSRLQVQQPAGCGPEPVPAGGAARTGDGDATTRAEARDPCVQFCGAMTSLCIGDCEGDAAGAEPDDCMIRCARDMGRCVDACR